MVCFGVVIGLIQLGWGRIASRTCIWVFCKAKAFGSSRVSVVDEAKIQDLASATEELTDLILGQAIGDVADEDHARGWLVGHGDDDNDNEDEDGDEDGD